MADARPPSVLSRQLILSLYLPAAMLALGQSMVAPVIPGLTKSYGVGVDSASLVFVAYSVGAFVATFPAGYLMDKIGRRPVLLAGPVLAAIGSFMTPFSHTFLELLFWRFVVGGATLLWQQGRVLVIADTAPQDQRAQQMQWMVGMTRAGQLFGPTLGGFLAAAYGLWIPFAVHAALMIVAVIPAYNLIQESAPGRRRKNDESKNDEPESEEGEARGWRPVIKYMITFQIVVFLCIQVLAQFSRGGQEQGSLNLYAVYAYNMGPAELGLLNTIAIVFGLPVPFLTGYLMDKFGRRAVIAPGFAAYGIAVALMSLTAFFPLPMSYFLATYVLVQATAGTTGGTMQVLGTDLSPQENRGRFFAIWRTIAQLAAAVAPAMYGLIAEHVGFGFAFAYLSLCAIGVVLGVSRVLGDTQAKR
ncbi:MAG TPA: MFS transporter [Gammaproteobacteria bacterium]|nr:MFS transporter [Gammaproteobacteria bacterium]